MSQVIYGGDSGENREHYDTQPARNQPWQWGRRLRRIPYIVSTVSRFLRLGLTGAFDTTDFSERADYQYKLETVRNWSSTPCGSDYSPHSDFGREHFEDIERYRYKLQGWLLEAINSFDIAGKKVLEIGYGAGTDHLALARRGGIMHGIDLTPASYDTTKRRFDLYAQRSELSIGDAELLPYPDEYFDFVYSFGVVHHSPNTAQVVNEIRRVLKPGGKCYVTVYHKNSVFFWWTVFFLNYMLKGGWKRRSLKQQLSLIEHPNNNENMVIRLYTQREFERLFAEYSAVEGSIRHLVPGDIDLLGTFLGDPYKATPFFERLSRKWGWYVVVEAWK